MVDYRSSTVRYVECRNCGETTEETFPFGYTGVGIATCPECGGRDIDIVMP